MSPPPLVDNGDMLNSLTCQSTLPFVEICPLPISCRVLPAMKRTRHSTTYGEAILPQLTVRSAIVESLPEEPPNRCTIVVPGKRGTACVKAPSVKSAIV